MSNLKLTYNYTLSSIEDIKKNIEQINTRLALVIIVGGILVNFGKDLSGYSVMATCLDSSYPYPCLMCYLLKLGSYVSILFAIAFGWWGIYPSKTGKTILPEQLLTDEWNSADENDYLQILVEYLEKETLLPLNTVRDQKGTRLENAIIAIVIAVTLLCLDEILVMSIPVLGHCF